MINANPSITHTSPVPSLLLRFERSSAAMSVLAQLPLCRETNLRSRTLRLFVSSNLFLTLSLSLSLLSLFRLAPSAVFFLSVLRHSPNEPVFFFLAHTSVEQGGHVHPPRARAEETFLRTNRFGAQKRIASFKNILEAPKKSARNFRLMVHRCSRVRAFFRRRGVLTTVTRFPPSAQSRNDRFNKS